jgi:hypothetical protein
MKLTHLLITTLLLTHALHGADIALSTAGKTEFRIVKPEAASPVDDYAVTRLSEYLRQITGAEFPVMDADQAAGDSPGLYVGISAAGDPLAALQDQEHVSRS